MPDPAEIAVPDAVDGAALSEADAADVRRSAALVMRRNPDATQDRAVRAALDAFRARHEVVGGTWRRRGRARLGGPDGVVVDLTRTGGRP